jgi:beta-N-acetylhexosaminidase
MGEKNLVCLSSIAVSKVRDWRSDAYILTDDLQMQGVQKLMSSGDACVKAVRAGADLIIIGNNLRDEQQQAAGFAHSLRLACEKDLLMRVHAEASINRTRKLRTPSSN